jgi:Arc/MetJ-type ribon-helix-helix transcriptional regulator
MSLRTVTVKLQDRLLAEIETVARARRVSRSEVVRERLEQAESPTGSVWDRMQDLVIEEDRAPSDLASNKARLRGYGRPRPR